MVIKSSLNRKKPSKKVIFADIWGDFFAGHGLNTFDDFFEYSNGQAIGKNNKRNVCCITLGQGECSKTFFMKRFENPHYKDMFGALINFGHLASQAAVEWNNANALLANGIGTYKPVCYGECKKWGLEKKSFFVTEKLSSTEFVDFVKERWLSLDRGQKKKIISDIGQWVNQIHERNICLPDLCVWHIFIDEESVNSGCRLDIIDLHRMVQKVSSKARKIKDLGKFYWSMTEKYFDQELKTLFLEAYTAKNKEDGKVSFMKSVVDRAANFGKHRNPKHY